jgi:hypothetical protein
MQEGALRTFAAELFPVWTPELGAYSDRYDVIFADEIVVERSRDPETDLARALLARGHTGSVTLLDGATGKPRTIMDIEKAAKVSSKERSSAFCSAREPSRTRTGSRNDLAGYRGEQCPRTGSSDNGEW